MSIEKQQELRILELELALQQSLNTIQFLHGCLTQSNFRYEYPDQTLQLMGRIEKLCPPQKTCLHSGFNEDCESCVERVETSKRLKKLIIMNKELIMDSYENYCKHFVGYDDIPQIDWFIQEIKTNSEFSEKWGLKIEERELSREERYNLIPSKIGHSEGNISLRKKINNFEGNTPGVSYHEEWLDSFKIPNKLIAITYNGETIGIYE